MNVDLSHVQRRPFLGLLDQQLNDWADRVVADQIVVELQVVNPPIAQLGEQFQCFLR